MVGVWIEPVIAQLMTIFAMASSSPVALRRLWPMPREVLISMSPPRQCRAR
jgi:hypothetical protein